MPLTGLNRAFVRKGLLAMRRRERRFVEGPCASEVLLLLGVVRLLEQHALDFIYLRCG